MAISENVALSSLTTFKLGGLARAYASCKSVEDVQTALAYARERGLPWYVIGGGSNLLANDAGYEGLIIHIEASSLSFDETSQGVVLAIVEAGASWDTFVQESVTRTLWGLENLAGIPGSVGGAPVQNIGAYGADVSQTLSWVEAFDTATDELRRFSNEECLFGYRDSIFKRNASFIIVRAAFLLSHTPEPHLDYADLKKKIDGGAVLDAPKKIAEAVREIRAGKFPDLATSGTAGSFFKNPTISEEAFATLQARFPELPHYPGEHGVKISVAWILDHGLNLRGYSQSHVRLFENQPLVIVADSGATAHDVDLLAKEVESKVLEATGITLEREVRAL